MKRHLLFILAGLAPLFLTPMPGHADSRLSADRLDLLDKWGGFTPGFKAAAHDLVDARQAMAAASTDEKQLTGQLPDLQKQAADTEARVAVLRKELAEYDHSDETDFTQLQKEMGDAGAKPEEQIALVQAYIWAYPASLHQAETQQFLQQVQKKLADQQQAEKDAEAARVAAHAKLLERVQARDLSLDEWKNFLRNMSQDDLLKYLGRPQSRTADYWIYSGGWTEDPVTHQKVGLQINFNAGRALSITESPNN